jgi:hypothetical protein
MSELTAYQNGSLPAALITKREAIAMQILAGLCSQQYAWENSAIDGLATVAVQQGDALLKILAGPEAS